MARSVIVFEDAPDGLIDFKVTHIDGYRKDSNAHKLAVQTVLWLDSLAQSKSAEQADTVPTDRIQNGGKG